MLRTSYSSSVAWASRVICPGLIPAGSKMCDRDCPDATTPESTSNASHSNPKRTNGSTGGAGISAFSAVGLVSFAQPNAKRIAAQPRISQVKSRAIITGQTLLFPPSPCPSPLVLVRSKARDRKCVFGSGAAGTSANWFRR